MAEENLKLIGTARCWYTDENGNKIHYTEKKNAIVLSGFDFVRQCITAMTNRPEPMGYVAVGDGSSATTDAMTALQNEGNRVAGTWSLGADGKSFTITAVFARGTLVRAVREVGVFNASTDGVMLDRAVYSSNIPALSNLEFTQTLTFQLA